MDYLGILLNVGVCTVTFVYAGLYGNPLLQAFYISLSVICASVVFSTVLSPLADGPQAAIWRLAQIFSKSLHPKTKKIYRGSSARKSYPSNANSQIHARTSLFLGLAASGFAPVVHMAILEGMSGVQKFPFQTLAIMALFHLGGAFIYVARVPEKHYPGTFDIWVSLKKNLATGRFLSSPP